jgi:2-polyprenyl-3-methyl-5-hydroxy-6-metoxy-1,4-benzoquinol methylase
MNNNPTILLEPANCSLCGSTEHHSLFKTNDKLFSVPGEFQFVKCGKCGLIYLNPRPHPNSFTAIYPEHYSPYQAVAVTAQDLHPDLQHTCSFINSLQPQAGKLLDIGSGSGNFLQAMHLLQPAWQLQGIEPDQRASEFARQQGLQVKTQHLEQSNFPSGNFDAVTLWNVFEHLGDPRAALRKIRSILKPSGILYLAVPMCDSWDARIFQNYWIGWEAPRHFVLYTHQSLQAMLASEGFQIVRSACVSGSEYCTTESLRILFRHRIQSFTARRLAIAISYSRPFRLLLKPYVQLGELFKRSTVLTVAARYKSK